MLLRLSVLAEKILARLKQFPKFSLLLRSPVVKVEHSNSSVAAIYREPTTNRLLKITGKHTRTPPDRSSSTRFSTSAADTELPVKSLEISEHHRDLENIFVVNRQTIWD
jgi:uncharacterized protein (DUF2252 family)